MVQFGELMLFAYGLVSQELAFHLLAQLPRIDEDEDALRVSVLEKPVDRGDRGEGLARTAGAENGHVRILIDTAVEDIHDDQAIVMLIHTQKDAIFIRHFITGEWITAGHGGCEHISLAAFEESLFQSTQRHD